jgi:hypothetical protein
MIDTVGALIGMLLVRACVIGVSEFYYDMF